MEGDVSTASTGFPLLGPTLTPAPLRWMLTQLFRGVLGRDGEFGGSLPSAHL
jgi:hypothetical protein